LGFDAGKIAHKRLVITDTLSNILNQRVLLANAVDAASVIPFWDGLATTH
jgi:hypothetical protein